MKWRVAIGAFLGVLLPTPLVLLLSTAMMPTPRTLGPEGARVSPVLDTEERTSRATYRRYCEHSSECDAPLGCFFDLRIATHYCTDSQCANDEQCPEEQVCRAFGTVGDGPLVRFCTPVGLRREGERCINLPRDKGAACGPGLLCGGNQGWCSRPCSKGDATSCPEGFFCAEVPPEPVCLPTCETRGCPTGQQCVRHEDGASACAVVYGPQCQQTSCPDGRKCEVFSESRHPGKVWMECVERCGEKFPPCPAGLACDGWSCQPSCDPEGPDTCAEGYRCQQRRPDRPWLCLPDR